MRIGIDAMGGDFAPIEALKGAILAKRELSVNPVLVGKKEIILNHLKELGDSDFEIIEAPDVIGMADTPTTAVMRKKNSSIVIGFAALKEGRIDGFASAGNTGAMLVASIYTIGNISGILRPTIASVLPKENGGFVIVVDVGFNADCKPEMLLQFAMLGSLFAEHVYKIPAPKIGLLNIGEEPGKGNILTQAAYPLLKENKTINFIGNMEGRDILSDKADVIVCDGFTGNIVLKMAEGIYEIIRHRKIKDQYFERFNYEDYGGTPILGANGPVIIGHGISNDKAFLSMVRLTKDVVEADLVARFRKAFN